MTGRMRNILILVTTSVLASCVTIAPYNEHAYQLDTSLKVQSLALISQASEPYAKHAKDAQALELKV